MRIEYETRGLIRFREMRIHFGMILSILRRRRINENTVGLILKIMVRLCICQLKMFKKSLLCISPPVPKWFN